MAKRRKFKQLNPQNKEKLSVFSRRARGRWWPGSRGWQWWRPASSVSDPYSLNPDPDQDQAKNFNPDLDPEDP